MSDAVPELLAERPGGPAPQVTVVMPTYGRAHLLPAALESLAGQEVDGGYEVIVIDDGSPDETPALLRRWVSQSGVPARAYRQRNAGPATARNWGIRVGAGSILAFMDDDCLAAPGWLAALTRELGADALVGGAGGYVRPFEERTLVSRFCVHNRWLGPTMAGEGELAYAVTANAAYTRRALEAVGGFDTGFRQPGGEDPELGFRIRRAGYRILFRPEAIVDHHHKQGIADLWRTWRNYGTGQARYVWKMGPGASEPREPSAYLKAAVLSLLHTPGRVRRYRREGLPLAEAVAFAAVETGGYTAYQLACWRELRRILRQEGPAPAAPAGAS